MRRFLRTAAFDSGEATMTLYKWSQTASADATADSTINWAEGQAPSSINDSARAMMAATAKYRDDIAGAIITSGTSTAYSLSSFQVFDTLIHLNGQMIAFTPHVTNGATVTLNVDSLGAKPLRSAPNTELLAGTIIQGTPYVATYNNNDGAFYLHGFFGNPYIVPLLGGMDYWDTVAPNSSFIFPQGQAISRTMYAAAFARWGTRYGAGDGATTFNVPNKMGKVSAMMESAQNLLTPTFFGADSTQLGSVGGAQSHSLTTNEMPTHNHGTTENPHTHGVSNLNLFEVIQGSVSGAVVQTVFLGNPGPGSPITSNVNSATTGLSINNAGGGNAHAIVQPTITCNYIIRIL
jgi:microcystin-dependent protein